MWLKITKTQIVGMIDELNKTFDKNKIVLKEPSWIPSGEQAKI